MRHDELVGLDQGIGCALKLVFVLGLRGLCHLPEVVHQAACSQTLDDNVVTCRHLLLHFGEDNPVVLVKLALLEETGNVLISFET